MYTTVHHIPSKRTNRLIPEFAAESDHVKVLQFLVEISDAHNCNSCSTLFCCGSNKFDNSRCNKHENLQSGRINRFYDWMGRLSV